MAAKRPYKCAKCGAVYAMTTPVHRTCNKCRTKALQAEQRAK